MNDNSGSGDLDKYLKKEEYTWQSSPLNTAMDIDLMKPEDDFFDKLYDVSKNNNKKYLGFEQSIADPDDSSSEEQPPDSQSSPPVGSMAKPGLCEMRPVGQKKRKHPSAEDVTSSATSVMALSSTGCHRSPDIGADGVGMMEIREEATICIICYDKSSGIHYGVPACEGCKGFFRRIVTSTTPMNNLKCNSGQNNCTMSPSTRNTCQRCRLQKCFNVGMTRKRSKLGRRSKQCKAEIEISPPRSADLNRILSDDELYAILSSESGHFHSRATTTGPHGEPIKTENGAGDPTKMTSPSSSGVLSNSGSSSSELAVRGRAPMNQFNQGCSQGMLPSQHMLAAAAVAAACNGQYRPQAQGHFNQSNDDMPPDLSCQFNMGSDELPSNGFDFNPMFASDSMDMGGPTNASSRQPFFADLQNMSRYPTSLLQQTPFSTSGPSNQSRLPMMGQSGPMASRAGLFPDCGDAFGLTGNESLCPPDLDLEGSCSRLSLNWIPEAAPDSPAMGGGSGRDSVGSSNGGRVTGKVKAALSERYKKDVEDSGQGAGLIRFGSRDSTAMSDAESFSSRSSVSEIRIPPVPPVQIDVGLDYSEKELDKLFDDIDEFFQTESRTSAKYLAFEKLREEVPKVHLDTCIVVLSRMDDFFRTKAFKIPQVKDVQEAWTVMLRNMAPVLMRVIRFCKYLPGLKDSMPRFDTVNVIKLSMFDVISLRFTRLVNLRERLYYDPDLTVKIPQTIMSQIPMGSLFDQYMKLAKLIESELGNQVDDPEMAFLSGYATTLPGIDLQDLISSKEHLFNMRFLYAASLYDHLLVTKFKGDRQAARRRGRSLFILLNHVRSVTKTHSTVLMQMMQNQEGFESLPLLLRQIFTDNLAAPDTMEPGTPDS